MTLTFYPLDVKFMLTLRPLKISYPQLSEESIQVISKFKTICLPTEKQFTYQLQSTVLTEGMEISSIKERVGGEDALLSNSWAWAFIFSQLILTRKLLFPPFYR